MRVGKVCVNRDMIESKDNDSPVECGIWFGPERVLFGVVE